LDVDAAHLVLMVEVLRDAPNLLSMEREELLEGFLVVLDDGLLLEVLAAVLHAGRPVRQARHLEPLPDLRLRLRAARNAIFV